MTDIDTAALRAATEAATVPMTCGGHQSMGLLIRCEECTGRMDARDDFDDAISPAVVLALLDRLASAEALLVKVPTVVTSVVRHVVGWPTPQAARTGRVVQMVMDNLQGPQIDTQERP